VFSLDLQEDLVILRECIDLLLLSFDLILSVDHLVEAFGFLGKISS
jgi:hypothetical protein